MIWHRLQGGIGAAFSVGPGYERQPLNVQASYERVDGYFVDLRLKALSSDRPRVNARGDVTSPGPTLLAQRALGFYDRHLSGEGQAAERVLDAVRMLLERGSYRDRALVWEYTTPVPKYGLRPPWRSCMAQGQGASALLRAYLLTGDEAYVEAALAAVGALTAKEAELVACEPEGPVLQECVTSPPSHILNGWIYALWGVWEVAVLVGDRASSDLFDRSVAALAALVPSYDTGWWSRYSLYSPLAPDVAKPFYHRIHVVQLQAMHRLTGATVFGEVAGRFAAYDRALHRARAVAVGGARVLFRRARAVE